MTTALARRALLLSLAATGFLKAGIGAAAPAPKPGPADRMQVTLLGTGSPQLNPNRFGPSILVQAGDSVTIIRQVILDNPEIGALVLGAAATGAPGPLVAHFAGVEAGQMPCPVMIVPGGLDTEALDRLS